MLRTWCYLQGNTLIDEEQTFLERGHYYDLSFSSPAVHTGTKLHLHISEMGSASVDCRSNVSFYALCNFPKDIFRFELTILTRINGPEPLWLLENCVHRQIQIADDGEAPQMLHFFVLCHSLTDEPVINAAQQAGSQSSSVQQRLTCIHIPSYVSRDAESAIDCSLIAPFLTLTTILHRHSPTEPPKHCPYYPVRTLQLQQGI